jgi:1-acylglycerone phosphate reductase
MSKRTVLITGCSESSLGAALAMAFRKTYILPPVFALDILTPFPDQAGLQVYATARNPSKMKSLEAMGITCLTLDVLSTPSITACLAQIPSLDILVNNAGTSYYMPISDLSIPRAKQDFDLNVWAYLEMVQAFLPLLLQSKGMIVNQTSVSGSVAMPFQSAYNASKAAIAIFSETMRLELMPFGITVVELKTGGVNTPIYQGLVRDVDEHGLPEKSIYGPARARVEKEMKSEEFAKTTMDPEKWAEAVVRDLLKEKPVPVIWRGTQAWLVRFSTVMPFGWFDGMIKKMKGLDEVERAVAGR